MKIGFLFPGQGSQTLGMCSDIYEKYDEAKEIYNKVNNITGLNIEKLTFSGTEEELNQTKNTQICILTMSLAILNILNKQGIKAEEAAGLSLGEYTALIYGNAMSLEDGVNLVKSRGRIMQEMCPQGEWSMAAIMGLEENKIADICKNIKCGFVSPANFNCIGQIVVSGEKIAILETMEKAKEAGAKKVIELKTQGPFHTEKLLEASKEFRKELEKVEIKVPEIPVIKNIDGKKYTNNDDIKEILEAHIINPVKFRKCIQTMLEDGIDTFVEIGPGKTLSGFVKRENKEVKIITINDLESLENGIKQIKEEVRNNE